MANLIIFHRYVLLSLVWAARLWKCVFALVVLCNGWRLHFEIRVRREKKSSEQGRNKRTYLLKHVQLVRV